MPLFGYELQGDGRWGPVRYEDRPPTPLAKEDVKQHTLWHQLHPDDVMLPLSTLQRLYPLDEDKRLKNELIERNKKERMKKMVRPVEGYLTSQGKFFDTEAKANLFETNILLREVFSKAFSTDNMGTFRVGDTASVVTAILDAIKVNHELVAEYLEAVKTVIGQSEGTGTVGPAEGIGEAGNEVHGQSTVDHPPNDTPLWEQESLPVGEEATAEAPTPLDGEGVEHGAFPKFNVPSKRRKK